MYEIVKSLIPTLVYGSETVVLKKKEESRIRDLCSAKNGLNVIISKSVYVIIARMFPRWYVHVRKMDENRLSRDCCLIATYAGEIVHDRNPWSLVGMRAQNEH